MIDSVNKKILRCKFCKTHAQGMLVPGEGSGLSRVLFLGEAPGRQEAATGRPFIGRAGKVLRGLINDIGLNEANVFITSAVKYLPEYVTPKETDITHGRTHLLEQIAALKPKAIVCLGKYATLSMTHKAPDFKNDHGKIIGHDPCPLFLSYHPAAALYNPKLRAVLKEDFKILKNFLKK